MRRAAFAIGLLIVVLAESAAESREAFVGVPPVKSERSSLKMKFQRYKSGQVEVVVRNTGSAAQTFDPQGLYFIPDGSANQAPQRMGAAGPFEVFRDGAYVPQKQALSVEAGATVKLRLQTFCLDSHRASPGDGQGFAVSAKRLPPELRGRITNGVESIVDKKVRFDAPAKGAAQGLIWKERNSKWIKIEGEGDQEKRAGERQQGQQRRYRQMERREVQVIE